MGDSSTVYNALSGTQAVTCEVGPGTYWGLKSKHGFALATDLKQGDVIYLSCHIALKSVTGLLRIGFEPVINGKYDRCWLDNPTGDFDGIITKSYTVSADVPAGTNLSQIFAYIQPPNGKTFTVADGGYARIDYLMMSIGQPAAWAPAEGETLTADGGGGAMTEPTNLVKTQPDETATYTVKGMVDDGGHKDFLNSALENIKLSANTSFHIGITIKPDKDIPSGRVWAWIHYKDDAGATNFANSSAISYVIPAGVWTRLEWAVTVPAGMSITVTALSINRLADETKFQATNFVVYPLAGGRIVRARGTTALVSVNDGAKGEQGIPGKDGKSPTVSVSKSGTVTTIVVTNADGSKTTQTVNDGVNGTPGTPGADGKTPYFHVKYSNDGGKTFTANSGETAGTYIGTCTDYNSADPTAVGSYTWAKIKGDTGTGVSAIVEQYYLSTSSTTQTGGSWSTTSPAWESGHYIWTRSAITWTTGTTTYTTPVLAQAINSANQKAETALASASGKGKSYYQSSQPSGGSEGDLWFELDSSGNAIGIYSHDGSGWVEMELENEVVASLDAAKVTSGSFSGKEFTGGTFTGSKFVGSNFVFSSDSPNNGIQGTDGGNKIAFYSYSVYNGQKVHNAGPRGDTYKQLILSPLKTNTDFDAASNAVLVMHESGNVEYVDASGAYAFGYLASTSSFRFMNKNGLGTGVNSTSYGGEEYSITIQWTGSRLRTLVNNSPVRIPVCDPLFDNSSNGMSSGASLNASVTNYDALDIFCKTDDGTQIYTKVCNPTVGTTFEVSVNHIAAGGGNMWIKTKQFKISSSTYITTASSGSSYFTGNVRISSNSIPATVSQSDNITIIKVVGWKY